MHRVCLGALLTSFLNAPLWHTTPGFESNKIWRLDRIIGGGEGDGKPCGNMAVATCSAIGISAVSNVVVLGVTKSFMIGFLAKT